MAMHTMMSENTIVNAAPNTPAMNTANIINPRITILNTRNRNILHLSFLTRSQ